MPPAGALRRLEPKGLSQPRGGDLPIGSGGPAANGTGPVPSQGGAAERPLRPSEGDIRWGTRRRRVGAQGEPTRDQEDRSVWRWRGKRVTPPRRTVCDDARVHEGPLRSDPGHVRRQVFARDRGGCCRCGLDAGALAAEPGRWWEGTSAARGRAVLGGPPRGRRGRGRRRVRPRRRCDALPPLPPDGDGGTRRASGAAREPWPAAPRPEPVAGRIGLPPSPFERPTWPRLAAAVWGDDGPGVAGAGRGTGAPSRPPPRRRYAQTRLSLALPVAVAPLRVGPAASASAARSARLRPDLGAAHPGAGGARPAKAKDRDRHRRRETLTARRAWSRHRAGRERRTSPRAG